LSECVGFVGRQVERDELILPAHLPPPAAASR
jgi:hypothetical protein